MGPAFRLMHGRLLGAAFLATTLVACGGSPSPGDPAGPGDGTGRYPPGQTDFVSGNPHGSNYGPGRGSDEFDGATGAPSEEGGNGGAGGEQRTVEEADVVRLDGHTLYVLNQYRGLQIVDLSTPDAPRLLGSAPIRGYPVEMYIRDGRAYVVTSNYYDVWYDGTDAVQTFRGSLVVVVDVDDPAAPRILGQIPVEGYVTDTRIVGNVLYAVSNRYAWYDSYSTSDHTSSTVILSVDVSNPKDAVVVDRAEFPLENYGWNNHVHVTADTIHVATPYYDYDRDYRLRTRIQEVDISDPGGRIAVRGSADVAGMVPSRWALDEHDGVLRVVAGPGWGNGTPELTTFAVGQGTLEPLGHLALVLPRPESLTAVRFDGVRGYVVTFEQVDPLFVLDLTDPAAPQQRGELEMPGWLDHLVPRGDRLVALGHDNTAADGQWRLSVSLFDVADITADPVLLDRVSFGAGWGWVPDDVDERDKVFKVLDDLGLILIPFHSYGFDDVSGYYVHQGGVQLVDFTRDDLVLRGLVEGGGSVRRALAAGNRILTVSNEQVQVVDATDRDAPRLVAELDLARNVLEFAVVNGVGVQLVGDWWSGDTRLVIVPLSDPDLGEPLGTVQITAPYSRMFVNGSYVYLVANDWRSRQSMVQTVDLTVPAAPVVRGSVVLPFTSGWYYRWCWFEPWYSGGDEVAQVGGDKLVFHVRPYSYWYHDGYRGGSGEPMPENDRLYVVDLADPAAPAIASVIDLPETMGWVYGVFAKGDVLHFSHYETAGATGSGLPLVRYYLDRVDLSDPADPAFLPKVNVPGYVLDVSDDRLTAYTLDVTYWPSTDPHQSYDWTRAPQYTLNTVRLFPQVAVLQDRLVLNDTSTWVSQVAVRGRRAVWTGYRYWNDDTGYHYENRLGALDVSNPLNLRAGTVLAAPQYGWFRAFEGTRAFYNTSYPSGLAVYDLADVDAPVLETFAPIEGWASQVGVYGDTAYVAAGYWGVQAIPLGAP